MPVYRVTPDTDPRTLVGRYVVKDAGMLYAAVTSPMKVVGARGKSVEVEIVPRWFCQTQNRFVIGADADAASFREGGERLPDVQVRHLHMACDTIEELDALIAHSALARDRFNAVRAETANALRAMVTDGPVPPAPGAEEPPAEPGP